MTRQQSTIPGIIQGTAYIVGDYLDADAIIPVRHCTRPTQEILIKHCLTLIDPDFPLKAQKGLIILAGKDFGRGSANENAVRALQLSGIKAVVAASFGLLFRRNAINMGLPIMQCPQLMAQTKNGNLIELELDNHRCADITAGLEAEAERFSEIEEGIIKAGGLVNWVKSGKTSKHGTKTIQKPQPSETSESIVTTI
jgi:3-isopropylmalate/(R)-2-methylmalate dehydratase small subunit